VDHLPHPLILGGQLSCLKVVFGDDPPGVCRGRIIREAAELSLLVVHQPTQAILWRMAVHMWSALVWHQQSLKGLHLTVELVFTTVFKVFLQ